jgi:flagellin-like hook-associated protein FlgL
MNEARRKKLERVIVSLDKAVKVVFRVSQDEKSAFGHLPEGIQGADRGAAMEAAISELDQALDHINDAIANIENARGPA